MDGPISTSGHYVHTIEKKCEHKFKHNKEENYVFCTECGERWESEYKNDSPVTTTTFPHPFHSGCYTATEEPHCMFDNVEPGTVMGLVCNCPRHASTC